MIEVSTVLFSLLVEGFIVLLLSLLALFFLANKRKSKDRIAIKKLIDQLKQQSKTRMQETGSFLSEKYQFEGNELEKAIKSIDKAEKKFMQKVINIYAKRNSDGLISLDAWVAELIGTYKGLTPVMPEAEALQVESTARTDSEDEISRLTELNEKLSDELKITKETMGNMIAEFGNMFGGGSEHELAQNEVLEKMTESVVEDHPEDDVKQTIPDQEVENQIDEPLEESPLVEENSTEVKDNQMGTDDIGLGGMDELIDDIAIEKGELDSSGESVVEDEKKKGKKIEDKKKSNEVTDEVLGENIEDLMDSLDLSE